MLVAQDRGSSTILLSNEYEPPEIALLTDKTEMLIIRDRARSICSG